MNLLYIICDLQDVTILILQYLCSPCSYICFVTKRSHYDINDIKFIRNIMSNHKVTTVQFVHCFYDNKYIRNRSMINMYTTKACISCLQIYANKQFSISEHNNSVHNILMSIFNMSHNVLIDVNYNNNNKKYICITLLLTETLNIHYDH